MRGGKVCACLVSGFPSEPLPVSWMCSLFVKSHVRRPLQRCLSASACTPCGSHRLNISFVLFRQGCPKLHWSTSMTCTCGSLARATSRGTCHMLDVAGFSKHHGTTSSSKHRMSLSVAFIVRLPITRLALSRSDNGLAGNWMPHGSCRFLITFVLFLAIDQDVHGVASMAAMSRRSRASRQSRRRFSLLHKSNFGPRSIL